MFPRRSRLSSPPRSRALPLNRAGTSNCAATGCATATRETGGADLDISGGARAGTAARRRFAGRIFQGVIGPENPTIVALLAYSDVAAVETVRQKLAADDSAIAAAEAMHNGPGAPWQRVETFLLRAFEGFPAVQAAEPKPGRIFELRMYESQDDVTLARKVKMFNDGEIGIFQRLGMMPVFFGETVSGPQMPNLIYMLSFDSLAARDRLWAEFGSDPAWKKMSSEPMLKDAEVVTNISNEILRPLAFSGIR